MIKHTFLILLFFSSVFFALFSVEADDLFSDGLEKYRLKEYDQALILLEEFRAENPGDLKSDDALWYLGRIYKYLDQINKAEQIFREVLTVENSNRLTEAAYDLGRILYSKKEYEEILLLFCHLSELSDPDSYEIRSLGVLADSYYAYGYKTRQNYEDKAASDFFIQAAAIYNEFLAYHSKAEERDHTLYDLGITYRHLANLQRDKSAYEEYYILAVQSLKESRLDKAKILLKELDSSRKADFEMEVTVLGGYDNLRQTPGLDFSAETKVSLPLGYNLNLSGSTFYKHNDFSYKTFNFDPAETSVDEKLIQTTDKIGADLVLAIGNRRRFINSIGIGTAYRFAEDKGDSYYEFDLSEDGDWRIDKRWKAGWDSSAAVKIFPDYLVSGHKIDSVQGGIFPYVRWYFSDISDLSMIYGFNVKQYLDAKYDSSVEGIDSKDDRQYISNSLELRLKIEPIPVLDMGLSYEVLLLESNYYDVWISDTLGTNKFIEDYNDYIQHTFSTNFDFQWSKQFRTEFDIDLEFRNYTNYIARDEAGVFLSGNTKRKDVSLSTKVEAGLIVTKDTSPLEAEILGQFWWDESISNMEYESSFDTNSTFLGGFLGMVLRFP